MIIWETASDSIGCNNLSVDGKIRGPTPTLPHPSYLGVSDPRTGVTKVTCPQVHSSCRSSKPEPLQTGIKLTGLILDRRDQ